MSKASAVLLLSLALAGCAAAPQAKLASDPAAKPARYAWDGAGEDPNQPKQAAATSRIARTVPRASQPEDGGEPDARLSRSLVICKGCLRQPLAEDARLAKASD
jgi:hypothetical protein